MTGAMPSAASSGEIVGLLLAAGKGRRFGSDKLMHRKRSTNPILT